MSLLKRFREASSLLFNSANPTRAQRTRFIQLKDIKRDLNMSDWKRVTAYSRALYTQLGEVRGPIREKATYSVGPEWIPQFVGSDKKWGNKAEEWAYEWMKICDIRGEPYDFHVDLNLASIAIDRDGDVGCLLTDSEYPQIQYIPAHRIGCRDFEETIKRGPYKGLSTYNGVIFNNVGRAVAYQILGNTPDQDQWVSARDMSLIFDPDWVDQGRGITCLSHAILRLFDLQDIDDATLTAIKAAATIALMEWNDDGEATSGSNRTSTVNSDGTGLTIEEFDRGSVRYFRSKSGGRIETLNDNRPSQNTSEFKEKMLRSVYQGLEWPYELARDASSLNGGPFRAALARAGRTVAKRQKTLKKLGIRKLGFGISKAIKLGIMPPSAEWWKWDFQMPRIITADQGRESQQDRSDIEAGLRTKKEDASEQGKWWEDIQDQKEIEVDDQLTRAARLAKKHNVSIEVALTMLGKVTPNGNLPTSQT